MAVVRAAAHVHSNWSYDARWPLADIAAAFRRRGYGAVLMAEHERGFDQKRWEDYGAACSAASSTDVVLVPGLEYEDASRAVHVAVWGAARFLGCGLEPGELLRRAREENAVAVLAHPWRTQAWGRLDAAARALLGGVELWNRKYDGWAPNPEARAALGDGIAPFVGLDFHGARQFFPLAMALSLDGPPTEERVIEALRAGAARCRPEAFGVSAFRLMRGPSAVLARGAEGARRPVARGLRRALAGRVR